MPSYKFEAEMNEDSGCDCARLGEHDCNERAIRTALQQEEKRKMVQNRNKMPTINKIAVSFVSTLILLTPLWIWLSFYFILGPEGFWQKLVIYGLGFWLLGGIQFFCLIGLVFWLFAVWE